MPYTTAERVGANVRAAARIRHLTQSDLADALGLTQSRISDRMRGTVAFDINELGVIAEILDVPVADLFTGRAGISA